MQTFTTRTQAIDFLVSQGKVLGEARVAVDQAFNYDEDNVKTDLIKCINNDDKFETCTVTEKEVLAQFEECYVCNGYYLSDKGYTCDDEDNPHYDIEGNVR